jgi:hypothetical protein
MLEGALTTLASNSHGETRDHIDRVMDRLRQLSNEFVVLEANTQQNLAGPLR